jgi:hypothetical protein
MRSWRSVFGSEVMTQRMHHALAGGQPTSVDPRGDDRSTSVDLELEAVRAAVKETGHTIDSLSAEMDGKDRSYINKVLNGDKPMSMDFIASLPEEVRAEYHAGRADAHGFVVGRPVDQKTALRYVVIGLASLAAALSLPAKADRMARMDDRQPERKRA